MVFGPPLHPHADDDIASFGARLGEALEVQVRRARALA
jgi:hypothetical protein